MNADWKKTSLTGEMRNITPAITGYLDGIRRTITKKMTWRKSTSTDRHSTVDEGAEQETSERAGREMVQSESKATVETGRNTAREDALAIGWRIGNR